MDEFGYEVELDVRFRDLDANGHVNNAVYATYAEQARVKYVEDVIGIDIDEANVVIATLDLEFRRPVEFGETVTVGVRVPELGTTSMPVEHEISTRGEVVATAESRLVHLDEEHERGAPIPDEWRERVARYEGH